MDRAAFDRIARRFAASSPVSRRAAAGMVLAAAAGSSANPSASAGPAAAKRCVRLGAACAAKSACCAGGACRKGVCACVGGKSVACGARCFPLVRHGYQPGACDKVPGTTFCADGFCRKSAISGDTTCACDAECCANPVAARCLNGRCCLESGASCYFGGDAVCCGGACRDNACA